MGAWFINSNDFYSWEVLTRGHVYVAVVGGYYLSSFVGQWQSGTEEVHTRKRMGYCIVNGLWNCSHFADRMSAGSFIKF